MRSVWVAKIVARARPALKKGMKTLVQTSASLAPSPSAGRIARALRALIRSKALSGVLATTR